MRITSQSEREEKVLLIDANKCHNCQNYHIVCDNDENYNIRSQDIRSIADKGQFYASVDANTGMTIPQVKIIYLNKVCQSCEGALCVQACSQKAIYKEKDGSIIIDPRRQTGLHSYLPLWDNPYHR